VTPTYPSGRLLGVDLTELRAPGDAMKNRPAPDALRPGSVVGSWHIEGYAGRGTYGRVYRARRVGRPDSPPVALKVAVFAYDPRFVREAGLLSRIHHPSVPQLLDRGWWVAGPEAAYPYLVMEWIHGLPLYEWAREHPATSRQVLRVLAQVAGALAVLHRAGGLHRDLKGDNILVDGAGRAVLMDYGSSTWAGAPPLTESLMPPNTREYRSPEALRFEWGNWRRRGARYQARPADDLHALGVTLYRLVTRTYPPLGTEPEELKEQSQTPSPRRLPADALNERVMPELSVLIEQLLAKEPEARGSACEVAEAAEAAAEHVGPEADVPLSGSERPKVQAEARPVDAAPLSGSEQSHVAAAVAVPVHVHSGPLRASWAWRPGLVVASLFLMAAGLWWVSAVMPPGAAERTQAEALSAAVVPGAKTRGLGDGTQTERSGAENTPTESKAITLDMPKQPLPGQRRPPCRRGEEVIHGACWRRFAKIEPPCGDDAYEWEGACFDPAGARARSPTSEKHQ
jgi:eukaryotic-like serine/threonine-protein kinase